MEIHINPNKEIKEGVLVRWDEYPDRLYFVIKTGISYCGADNYCEIISIDHKHKAFVPIADLVWDDVDYVELESGENVSDVVADCEHLLKNSQDLLDEIDVMNDNKRFLLEQYKNHKHWFRDEPGRVTTEDIIKTCFEFGWASRKNYEYDKNHKSAV